VAKTPLYKDKLAKQTKRGKKNTQTAHNRQENKNTQAKDCTTISQPQTPQSITHASTTREQTHKCQKSHNTNNH